MKYIFYIICFFFGNTVPGQTEHFNHYTLHDHKLKTFQIHLASADSTVKKPLLVYLDGSGNFPLYYRNKSGNYSTSVPLDIKKYAKDFHILLISKPGIPFKDSLQTSPSGRRFYPENEAYTNLYSLDWRAGAASKAIDFIRKKVPVDKNKIVVMGYSEGSQVAPYVAVLNRRVTHVVSIVGNAMPQFYDFLTHARLDVERNKMPAVEGQKVIDSLYTEFDKIFADPLSVKKKWYGETYLKWSSFNKKSPLENMLELNIPILYIAAGKDNNQPIFGMDYAKLEFTRRRKNNLTYKVYPDSNHYFQDQGVDMNGSKTDRIDEVHQFAMDWLIANPD